MKFRLLVSCFVCILALLACGAPTTQTTEKTSHSKLMANDTSHNTTDSIEIATFGAGCFWCVEAIFQNVKGVIQVQSGYSGGAVKNPSYKEVCTGRTGHAEVCQVTFDPRIISFSELLEVFFATHDPTTLNRQGADVGTQYRSAIFYHNDKQKELATLAVKAGNESGNWPDPIVTEVSPFDTFFRAEDYHDDYFQLHGEQPYCQMVIRPKVDKFRKKFSEYLKDSK